jgi:hypothetical protein
MKHKRQKTEDRSCDIAKSSSLVKAHEEKVGLRETHVGSSPSRPHTVITFLQDKCQQAQGRT